MTPRTIIRIKEDILHERISRKPSGTDFQRIVKHDDLKFRVNIHVDNYPEQSWVRAEMYFPAEGWRELLYTVLPTDYSLANTSVRNVKNDSYDEDVYNAFEWDCYQILKICRGIIS